MHLTFDLLVACERGALSRDLLASIGFEHLNDLCPVCRAELAKFLARRRSGPARPAPELLALLQAWQIGELQQQVQRARKDLTELLSLPAEKRIARIERARQRFRGPALGLLLLEESRGVIHEDPHQAFHLSQLAAALARTSPATSGSLDLLTLSSASMANSLRAAGNLKAADGWFAYARDLIEVHGVTSTEVLAEVDCLEGSLRRAQRRLADATKLLDRAVVLFRIVGATRQVARALLAQGTVQMERRDIRQAIAHTREALSYLTPEADPKLYLWARHNLAQFLSANGDHAQAAEILSACETLYEFHAGRTDRLRHAWLRGRIDFGLGRIDSAQELFEAARHGFLAQGDGFDAALVSLDLARLHLHRGQTAEVRRLAEEMVLLFEAQEVHRETLAALRIFEEAAQREAVTAALIKQLTRFLERSRTEPTRRFIPLGGLEQGTS